jgi:hypothetical protein
MKNIIPLILSLILISGCSQHSDSIAKFVIKGKVVDKITNQPIRDVKVLFTDTGLDSKRSLNPKPKIVVMSDSLGFFNVQFTYWWGIDKGLFSKEPRRTFTIELSNEKYFTEKVDYHLSDSLCVNDKIMLSVNTIYLTKEMK